MQVGFLAGGVPRLLARQPDGETVVIAYNERFEIDTNGQIQITGMFVPSEDGGQFIPKDEYCFVAGTMITMWPTVPNLRPITDGISSKVSTFANVWKKPIEDIRSGDIVMSYNTSGELVPGTVSRVFQNEVAHLLDVHGLKVTPGHVTLCGDGRFAGCHVPIIDILLSDGALVREDGTLVRIATNARVGSIEDQMIQVQFAETSEATQSGDLKVGKIRVGTLLFDREGTAVSVLDCIRAQGLVFDDETGLVSKSGSQPEPLKWFGQLPKPEDYILRRSQETLEGILTDGEWEGSASELIADRMLQTAARVH